MKDIYLASPFFTDHERTQVHMLEKGLESRGFTIFSPSRDAGICDGTNDVEIFRSDIRGIRKSRLIVANVTNFDPGTIWEIGYGFAIGRMIILWSEHNPHKQGEHPEMNNMLRKSTTHLFIGGTIHTLDIMTEYIKELLEK